MKANKKPLYILLSAIAFLGVIGCESVCMRNGSNIPSNSSGFRVVTDAGSPLYIAAADLNRDFMPVISNKPGPYNGKPLLGIITCRMVDGANISKEIKIEKVSLKYGNETWETVNFETEIYPPEPEILSITIRNGPMWPPAVNVDVNVQFNDGSGSVFVTAINNQLIQRSM